MALKNNIMFQYISYLRKFHPTCQFCCPPAGHVSPLLSLSPTVWERPDLKRRENHWALASTLAPHFSDQQVCEGSLLLSSNVQHLKDPKTQNSDIEKSFSNWDFIKYMPKLKATRAGAHFSGLLWVGASAWWVPPHFSVVSQPLTWYLLWSPWVSGVFLKLNGGSGVEP